jgi:multisubunit Na+/H+ antiporter MnhB subunit
MFRFENAFAQTSMLLVVMGAVIAACFAIPRLRKRLPDGMILLLAGVLATLVDGWGFAIRHWVEGSYYFFNLILTIASGMVKEDIFEVGLLATLTRTLGSFRSRASLSFLMLIMFPGMVTGRRRPASLPPGS